MQRTVYVSIAIATLGATLFVMERFVPLRGRVASLGARPVIDLAISALAFLAAGALVRPSAGWTQEWLNNQPFGLLHTRL